jgi:predicted glycosyl hydrolase (DUF1957 family)
MTIRHPESSLPMDGQTITLLGTDSRIYREHIAKRERAMLEHVNATHKPPKLVHEQTKQRALDDLVLLTIGWTLDGIDGKPVEFSKEAARELYADTSMAWLREQVESFVQDRSNFLQK